MIPTQMLRDIDFWMINMTWFNEEHFVWQDFDIE